MKKFFLLLVALLASMFLLCSCECKHKELSEADCITPQKCLKCNESIGEALGHTDGEWIIDKESTCTEDGSKHQICSVCNVPIKTETLSKLGHTDGEWITDKESTCTEDGTKHQVCSVCNITIKTETLVKLGHTDGEWIIDKNPTCTEDGSKHQACSVCNFTIKTETLTKLGHTDGEWIIDTEANCTENGTKHQVCAICTTTIKADVIISTGHSFEVTSHPTTCVDNGYDEYKCKNCEYTKTKPLEDLNCSISLEYLGYEMLSDILIYTLNIEFTGYGSPYYDADAVVIINGIYWSNISEIYPPTHISYDGNWNLSQTIYLPADSNHIIAVDFNTSTGYGFSCNYDVSNGTYTYDYNPLHRYENVVTAPTKTEDGYTTHICSICGDSYVDAYTDAIGSTGLSYKINENGTTCTITGIGTCTDENIYIPTYIDGYMVTSIGERAFENLGNIKNIYISKTITHIGNKAFFKCSGITEIRIPENVTLIGSQIFLGCESLKTVYYDSPYAPPEGETFLKNASIKKIVFGDNLTTIPNYICYNCDNLEEIILSQNTKYIGNYAFYYCKGVKQMNLPDGLINTGWYAFYEMEITEIIIPNSVESIYNSFRGCIKLEKIVLPVSIISVPNQTFYLCTIKEVYYMGTELEWSSISISEDSNTLKGANVYFYSENPPMDNSNYWHYVDDVPTIWK